MNSDKTVRPFGIKDKLGYLFGDLGNDFTFMLCSGFLLKFYTDVMGTPAAAVGVIMMLSRFVDGFTDVFMGRLCDKSRQTPQGKFRPWIIRMCLPVAVSCFLIFQSSLSGFSVTFKTAYLFVTYILWGSVFYTSVNIPYGSMASAISHDPSHRQSLSTYRSLGGMLAGALITAVIPIAVYDNIGGKEIMNGGRFTLIAGICCIAAVICYILCYSLVTERVVSSQPSSSSQVQNIFHMLRKAAGNRALISIIAASIVMLLSQLTLQQMVNYVYPNYYGNASMQSISTLTMLICMIISAGISGPLVRRFGKAEVSVAANLFAGFISILLFFIRPSDVWIYVIFQSVAWLGLGVFSMVSWALITDVIDYSEIRNGVREDGSVYALYSFARKLGQAASSGITGVLLSYVGYSEETAFSPEVTRGIFNISTLVPGIGLIVLALILWLWYPLKKKQVEENVEILRKKRNSSQ